MRNYWFYFNLTLVLFSIVVTNATAETVPPLIEFESDTPALAAEVNANLDALKIEVDDNAGDIDQLESDVSSKQNVVTGTCPAGSAIRSIDPNGAVVCETDDDSGGDINGVAVGVGIVGGGTSGSVFISADTDVLQLRVNGACSLGSTIRAIAANGTVTCAPDADSGGDITGVSAGSGLTGGGSEGGVTLSIPTGGISSSEILDGSITAADILSGSITDAQIADAAMIGIAKIFGDVGMEFTTLSACTFITGSDTALRSLGSIALTSPAAGNVLVVHSGFLVFFGDNRTVSVGVGTGVAPTAFVSSSNLPVGDLDGTGTGRYEETYTTFTVVPVGANRTTIFHAAAQGNTAFDSNSVNVCPRNLAAIFIPKRY